MTVGQACRVDGDCTPSTCTSALANGGHRNSWCIDKQCRAPIGERGELGASCDCLRGCLNGRQRSNSFYNRDLICEKNRCISKPCTPCGHRDNGLGCCPETVVRLEHGICKCYIATGGPDCVSNGRKCDDGYSCCDNGKCVSDNGGEC